MRKANVLFLVLFTLVAGSSLAACPDVLGIWSSNPETNPDYALLNGRISEGWCNGAPGAPGNTQNAMSWDGATLGTDWMIWGMTINAGGPVLVFDGVSGGNGVRIYQTAYDGGEFILDGSGEWTSGDVDLNGTIHDYLVVTTVTYSGGAVVAAVSNITLHRHLRRLPARERLRDRVRHRQRRADLAERLGLARCPSTTRTSSVAPPWASCSRPATSRCRSTAPWPPRSTAGARSRTCIARSYPRPVPPSPGCPVQPGLFRARIAVVPWVFHPEVSPCAGSCFSS